MKKINICIVCGGKEKKHREGCKVYTKYILRICGNWANVFLASDNGLLPKPPWEEK